MSKMHNPPHHRRNVKRRCATSTELTITEAAEQLDVARVTLSRMINWRNAISADMAIRLAQWPEKCWNMAMFTVLVWLMARWKNSKIKIKPAPTVGSLDLTSS